MASYHLLRAAVLTALFPLTCLAADPAPDQTISGKLAANKLIATAAGVQATGVTDWSVRRDGNLTVFEAPENDARIAIVDLAASDGAAAIKAAWARLGGPNAARVPLTVSTAPARFGWEERIVADYDVAAEERSVVQASATRKGALWSVTLVEGSEATVGKRGAAVGLITSSVRPAGFKAENFAGRKPNPMTPARVEQMRAFLALAMKDAGVPGVGFALLENGRIVHEGGVGVRELGKPTPVDANTMFMAASNTKGMSTLLLATLVDQKKLRWDQPVTQVYPAFRLGSDEVTRQVLVKHLVCACTGLPRRDLAWIFEYQGADAQTSLKMLAQNSPTSGFGELYQYNNLMASAAGYVGGHLAYPKMELGKAFDKAMDERIFKPLGMKSTTFDMARALRGNHASAHATGFDNIPRVIPQDMNYSVVPHRPAGGVWTTAHDFIRYVQLEANAGRLPNGKQLVSSENLLARRQPQVSSGRDRSYGMGLSTMKMAGLEVLYHGGSLFGYKSNFFLLPETGTGLVLLTNSDEGQLLLTPTLRRMLEVLYDGAAEAAEDASSAAKREAGARGSFAQKMAAAPDAALAGQLAAHYRNAELGDLRIKRTGAALVADLGEWRSDVVARKNESGSSSLITVDPALAGLELVAGVRDGKRTLMVTEAQHEYVFEEVK